MLLKLLFVGALALGQAVAGECPRFDEVQCATEDGNLVVNIKRTINPDGAVVYTFASDDVISTKAGNLKWSFYVSGRFVVGERGVSCSVFSTGRTLLIDPPTIGFSPPRTGLFSISVLEATEGPRLPNEHAPVEMSVQYWTGAENPQNVPYPRGYKRLSCSRI